MRLVSEAKLRASSSSCSESPVRTQLVFRHWGLEDDAEKGALEARWSGMLDVIESGLD